MIIKRILSGLLCGVILLSLLTACSDHAKSTPDSKAELMHDFVVRAPKKTTELTATFLNTGNGNTVDIAMEKDSEDDSSVIFRCEADVNLYNMVHVTYQDESSMDVAFNSFVSGWNYTGKDFLPYTQGKTPSYDPKFETKEFQFDGRDKLVYIWTPEDYDAKSAEKYSVIYLFDGQSVLATGKDRGMDNDLVCWNVAEHIESMMATTEHKAIVVGIENNDVYRWDELVPDLGEINMEESPENAKEEDLTRKRGTAFADFVIDTVMPYVNENYHVYTDAKHTALAGASLGGLETRDVSDI